MAETESNISGPANTVLSAQKKPTVTANHPQIGTEKEFKMRFAKFSVALALAVAVASQVTLADDCKYAKSEKPKDIVDTAVAAGNFKTLAAALTAADLIPTLKGKGPFTVFAPTDKAFGKLPKGTVEELLKPENRDKLVAVLTYHVVPGRVMAADVLKLSKAKTVQGSEAKISVKEGKVYVDNALVTATDIKAANGVIHVIDSVILPN